VENLRLQLFFFLTSNTDSWAVPEPLRLEESGKYPFLLLLGMGNYSRFRESFHFFAQEYFVFHFIRPCSWLAGCRKAGSAEGSVLVRAAGRGGCPGLAGEEGRGGRFWLAVQTSVVLPASETR